VAAGGSPHRSRELVGGDHDVGAELLGELALVGIAGAGDDADVGHVAAQSGDRREAHRARAEHGDDRR